MSHSSLDLGARSGASPSRARRDAFGRFPTPTIRRGAVSPGASGERLAGIHRPGRQLVPPGAKRDPSLTVLRAALRDQSSGSGFAILLLLASRPRLSSAPLRPRHFSVQGE